MSLDIAWVLTSSRNDKISEIESADKMRKLGMWSDLLKVSQLLSGRADLSSEKQDVPDWLYLASSDPKGPY